MPAINPTLLNEKIHSMFDRTLDIEVFPKEIYALLSFYADRTKRSSAVAAALESAESLRVPAPVMRALCNTIHQRGLRQDDQWIEAADKLWESGLREMRQVSVCLLSEAPVELIVEKVAIWADESDDPPVLKALADEGLFNWRRREPEEILDNVKQWLAEDSTRAFGLMALQPLVEEETLGDLPWIFEVLNGLPQSARGMELDALQSILRILAQRSPAETTSFLIREAQAGETRPARLIRAILDVFPLPFQVELRQSI
jgi:hypothetical protein